MVEQKLEKDAILLQISGIEGNDDIISRISLNAEGNVKTLIFESPSFVFKIFLTDVVDFDDFISYLDKRMKKVQILCHLFREEKEYKGKRKFVWKDGKMVVSQGGMRIAFNKSAYSSLREILRAVKKSQI